MNGLEGPAVAPVFCAANRLDGWKGEPTGTLIVPSLPKVSTPPPEASKAASLACWPSSLGGADGIFSGLGPERFGVRGSLGGQGGWTGGRAAVKTGIIVEVE